MGSLLVPWPGHKGLLGHAHLIKEEPAKMRPFSRANQFKDLWIQIQVVILFFFVHADWWTFAEPVLRALAGTLRVGVRKPGT